MEKVFNPEEFRWACMVAMKSVVVQRPDLILAFERAARFRSRYPSLAESIRPDEPFFYALREVFSGYYPNMPAMGTIASELLVDGSCDEASVVATAAELPDSSLYGFWYSLQWDLGDTTNFTQIASALIKALTRYVVDYRMNLSGDLG